MPISGGDPDDPTPAKKGPPPRTTRVCVQCRVEMPLESFRPKELGLYGRRSFCYACEDDLNDIMGNEYASEYSPIFMSREIKDRW